MFTLVYYKNDDDGDCYELGCRYFDDPDEMGKWTKEYYKDSDWVDSPPIMIFQGELMPLKCKWALILEMGDLPPRTRSKKNG